jgi:hypothetical protein
MFILQHALVSLFCLLTEPAHSGTEGSYLYYPATSPDGKPSARIEPYVAHEGDIVRVATLFRLVTTRAKTAC